MDYASEVQIRRQSPFWRRRRRRAQQQSACCGCALVVVIAVLATVSAQGWVRQWRERRDDARKTHDQQTLYFPLDVVTDALAYPRYGLVRLRLTLRGPAGQPDKFRSAPPVYITREGKIVDTVGGVERLKPRYEAVSRSYACVWPVPWNAPPGRYVAEVRFRLREPGSWAWETPEDGQARKQARGVAAGEAPGAGKDGYCVVRAAFEVQGRKPTGIPPGLCAATWESDLPGPGSRIRRPDGTVGDWRAIYDWCEFMGADALWVRGALTSAAADGLTMQQPFVTANLNRIPAVAQEAHRRGLKFGVWAMAYNTLPENASSNRRKPPYTFAKDISRTTGQVTETSFVSFTDQRRLEHLAGFLRQMQAEPNVDYAGLDYMRTEPGYELTDRFAADMPVELPANWATLGQTARWRYVAERAEPPGCYEHTDFYEAWNWYRARVGAQIAERLIANSGLSKPLWIFALSWRHGVQHGQDPVMFTDAGVGFLAPMLYQTTREHFDRFILRDWHSYLKAGEVNLLCGDQVDDYWHQRQGPGEMYRRMVAAHEQFEKGGRTQGAFWHDISRAAVVGNLGAYPGTEWALAGGAAFSRVRESWGVQPLRAALKAPAKAAPGASFGVELSLENLSRKSLRGVVVQPLHTELVALDPAGPRQVAELDAGNTLTMPFTARTEHPSSPRGNRFMVAFRITWPAGDYGEAFRPDVPRVIIVMQYVTAG
jgi:hypothetical protein